MHHIKKYANRKLYDTSTKRYVTMDDISEFVKSGEEITIIDNSTGNEITQEIVSQLVGRAFDDQARKLPLSVLRRLMRKGSGGLVDYTRKYVSLWQNALTFADDELVKVDTFLGRDKTTGDKQDESEGSHNLQDSEEIIQLLDQRIDQRLEKVLENSENAQKQQITNLKSEITRLSARLETFENIFSRILAGESKNDFKPSGKVKKS